MTDNVNNNNDVKKEEEIPQVVEIDGFKLTNHTPHAVSMLDGDTNEVLYKIATSEVARVEEKRLSFPPIGGTVTHIEYGDVVGVPDPEEGVFRVVSRVTADKLREEGRTDDILFPGTAVRNEKGQIIGVTDWGTFAVPSQS
jgi:hypothetical protein